MSEETLRKLCLQVRNWGKWGPDDEIGEDARLPTRRARAGWPCGYSMAGGKNKKPGPR